MINSGQHPSNHGQGNGSGLKMSYLCFHETFASLWPHSWYVVLETNLVPLWYELGPRNVYRKYIDISFRIGQEWTKGILVETLEPIWCVEGSNKISKTWTLIWNFWYVAWQSDFLVSSKCLPIWGFEFIVLESIANWHSTYCNWKWRCKNYFLSPSLISPFNF